MAESEKQSFWTTLPGVLTGIAALLTAVTGLMIAVYSHGSGGAKGDAASKNEAAKSAQAEGTSSSAASPPQQKKKPTVLVTAKDGGETRLFLNSFKDSYSDASIQLKNGQSIAFEKIGAIDFLEAHDYLVDVRVTLTDGRTAEGAVMSGEHITGESELGPFSTSVANLRRVAFER